MPDAIYLHQSQWQPWGNLMAVLQQTWKKLNISHTYLVAAYLKQNTQVQLRNQGKSISEL